mgnify:CR=1 FL=1|tara:strand:- start:664 stop:978 length:315 start_codon:yes stop_codon:yes gene_type:complete
MDNMDICLNVLYISIFNENKIFRNYIMPRTTTTVSGMLTTQNQGGGSKKAGLVPTETASVAQALAYAERSAKQPLTFKMKELYPGQPKCMSRPTGLRPMTYFKC